MKSLLLISLALAIIPATLRAEDDPAKKEKLAKEWLKYMEGEWEITSSTKSTSSNIWGDTHLRCNAQMFGDVLAIDTKAHARDAGCLSVHRYRRSRGDL